MSLRYEQYRSLELTKEFMYDLLTVDKYPKTKKEMQKRVLQCLRHFPFLLENGQPRWSEDEFTTDL